MPELITTIEELAALPQQSVITDKYDDVGVVHLGTVWYPETAPMPLERVARKCLPARVLHRSDRETAVVSTQQLETAAKAEAITRRGVTAKVNDTDRACARSVAQALGLTVEVQAA